MSSMPATRHAIMQLMAGHYPEKPAEEYRPWDWLVTLLTNTLKSDGPAAVREQVDVAARADRGLAELLASDDTPAAPPHIPALPAALAAAIAAAGPCGAWLDRYSDYAARVSPRTPRDFHEAAGLFLVATTIARRLVIGNGPRRVFPNIFVIFIAQPGKYAKSTAFDIMENVLRAADLDYLLLPQSFSPESLRDQFGLRIPAHYTSYTPEMQKRWLKQRAQASKRGFALDEVSFLFDEMKKEYMTSFLGLLLKLYDGPALLDRETKKDGYTLVTDALLSFFGASTPDGMQEHLANERLWNNGLWSRFALLQPDGIISDAPFPDGVEIPDIVISGLQKIDALFPKPEAEFVEKTDDGEVKQDYIEIYNDQPPTLATIHDVARPIFTQYNALCTSVVMSDGVIDDALIANYTRFPEQVLRVAMLLATMDGTTTIYLPHMARALRIVESWRMNMHRIWDSGRETTEIKQARRILAVLEKPQYRHAGLTVNELRQDTHYGKKEIEENLTVLSAAGRVEMVTTTARNGKAMQKWKAT